jgi:hypothetical protein
MPAGRLDLAIALLGHAVTAAVAIAASLAILGARGAGQGARIVTFDPDRSVIAFIEALPEEIGEAGAARPHRGVPRCHPGRDGRLRAGERSGAAGQRGGADRAEDVTERILDRVLAR